MGLIIWTCESHDRNKNIEILDEDLFEIHFVEWNRSSSAISFRILLLVVEIAVISGTKHYKLFPVAMTICSYHFHFLLFSLVGLFSYRRCESVVRWINKQTFVLVYDVFNFQVQLMSIWHLYELSIFGKLVNTTSCLKLVLISGEMVYTLVKTRQKKLTLFELRSRRWLGSGL